jgi:hypothetical protein
MASDKLYPGIGPFAVGFGASNDPIRATLLSFIVAVGFILIGEHVSSSFGIVDYGHEDEKNID